MFAERQPSVTELRCPEFMRGSSQTLYDTENTKKDLNELCEWSVLAARCKSKDKYSQVRRYPCWKGHRGGSRFVDKSDTDHGKTLITFRGVFLSFVRNSVKLCRY